MFYEGLYTEIGGNTILEYLTAVGIFIVLLIVFALVQKFALRYFKRIVKGTKTNLDDALVSMVSTVTPPFYVFVAFYLAVQYIAVEGKMQNILDLVLIAWLAYQMILAVQVFVDYFINKKLISEEDRSSEVVGEVLRGASRITLWAIGILFVLSNVGVNVTSLVAGLGVGGIALALAAQSVLGDLFSSLAIYFDKPFVPGEFITIGDVSGTVQKVGIKTTRIKSLSGEEIVVPNNEITSAKINNLTRMERRRISFGFGVVYETPSEKMDRALVIVKEVIESVDKVAFGRVHFKEFADSALNFEAVYFVEEKAYDLYMNVNQEIMLNIKKQFEEEGIEMAYPTQTLYVHKNT